MACLGEVTVFKVLYVSDVSKRDSIAMLTNDIRDVIVRVCVKASRAESQAVILIVDHSEEAVDIRLVYEQARKSEDIPRGIVHVDRHLDVALTAGGHYRLEEVLEVCPELLVVNSLVRLEELVELCHTLGLPAGKGHIVFFGEIKDILCHSIVIVLDHILLVEKRGRAVSYGMKKVASRPVEYRHEVIAYYLNAELGEISDGCFVVFDIGVATGKADLDIIVNVDRLDHVHVESVLVKLALDLGDLTFLPYLSGHLMVERPHDTFNTRDLLDV